MLTRFVRMQLAVFTIASIVGVLVMVFAYIQAPMLLGVGRMTVRLEMPATGGLYRFSNVTYRGAQIGKVTAIELTDHGATAKLSLDTSPKIPATDLQAKVLSVSAVGEQYVDLLPNTDSGPYLHDGSVIAMSDEDLPQAVGPMLDQVNALLKSIPQNRLSDLLDESYRALNGAGFDLESLSDASAKVAADANRIADRTRALIDDSSPMLDGQAQTVDAIRTWARSLAHVTGTVVDDDRQVRTLLKTGQDAADQASGLLQQIKPTLPVLLANLTTLEETLVVYRPAIEQLLVLLPPTAAAYQSFGPTTNATGVTAGDFVLSVSDPPACTVGFLPPSQWRSPADTTTIDTPDGLYCKLPQDSPLNVRGARNIPCMRHPGKRAPTVAICDSDQPFVPLAMRQHAVGPLPFNPSLIAQGIPPDDRVTFNDQIYGPLEGTPLPPGVVPGPPAPAVQPTTPDGLLLPPVLPAGPPHAAADPEPGAPGAAPSAFGRNDSESGPSVAVAEYNPKTGVYVTPDGKTFQRSDIVSGKPKSWRDMLPA